MTRWIWKRWVWAVLAGAAVAAGSAAVAQPGKPAGSDGMKPSDTITLKAKDPTKPDRKVKVLKTTRKPDGSVETEVKDPATGETFTLTELPPNKADAATPAGLKEPILPRAKPRTNDPLTPGVGKPTTPAALPPAAASAAPTEVPPGEAKKPGLISRLFGSKKPAPGPTATPAMSAPAASSSAPPKPIVPSATGSGSSVEPPRTMPAKSSLTPPPAPSGTGSSIKVEPVNPPAPVIQAQPPLSANPPAALPLPMTNTKPPPVTGPAIPPVPVPSSNPPALPIPTPPPPGLPTIPKPPGGVSPAGFVSPQTAMLRDIEPHLRTLAEALPPTARLTAATALAQCRHASGDAVKGALFEAAKSDPCPAVRAACIDHLCTLGYFAQPFRDFVKAACDDPNAEVRAAARTAVIKMTPRQW